MLPPQSDGLIPVYFLTRQTEENSFPFGGHYEVDVSARGRVTNARAFTNSCITMTKRAPGDDGKPAMMLITHPLDPVPTEVHVFEQYYVGGPAVVGVPKPRSVSQ